MSDTTSKEFSGNAWSSSRPSVTSKPSVRASAALVREGSSPASSTWKQKALLLGATLMIDFRFFEKQKKNNNNQGGFAA